MQDETPKPDKFQTTIRLSDDDLEALRAWGVAKHGSAFADFSISQQLKKALTDTIPNIFQ